MKEGHFRDPPPWGSETPQPIQMKFGMFDYVHRPALQAKHVDRRKGGGQLCGEMKLYPRMLFKTFFGSSNARTPEKREFSLNAPKMCLGGEREFIWGHFATGSNLPHLTPKPFSLG